MIYWTTERIFSS